MLLYLIRHGNHCPPAPDLTPKGRAQAARLAQRLAAHGIQHIFTSPLERTLQTSAILNETLRVAQTVMPALHETRMGDVETHGWDHARQRHPEFYAAFQAHQEDIAYPGGESGADVWRRVEPALREVAASGFERVAVVTHAGVIRTAVAALLGLPQQRRFFLGNPPENCGLTVLDYDAAAGQFYIQSFNDRAHLEPDLLA